LRNATASNTTLLELKFGKKVSPDEAQGEQFPNRRLPQPFTHPPMHLGQRESPPVRAWGKKRPVAAQGLGAVPGCAPPPRPENCSSALPTGQGEETRPRAAPASDPRPAPFSLPPDIAPPRAGDGHTRRVPPRGAWAESHSRTTSRLPAAPGSDGGPLTTPRAACPRPPPARSAGRETAPATTPWRLHSTRCGATHAGGAWPAPQRPGAPDGPGPGRH
jgi:hypothetical protein